MFKVFSSLALSEEVDVEVRVMLCRGMEVFQEEVCIRKLHFLLTKIPGATVQSEARKMFNVVFVSI